MQSGNRQMGVLFLTNYRLVFVPSKRNGRVQSVPLGCIAQLDVSYNVLRVLCKYFRLLEFCWPTCMGTSVAADVSVSSYMWGAASISSSVAAFATPVQTFRQSVCDQMATPFCLVAAFNAANSPRQQLPHVSHQNAQLYAGIGQEMRRLNVPTSEWRISNANESYALCSTYPRYLCVPAGVTDEQLRAVASFRSSARLPALCWYSAASGAALLRCAQPLAGLLRASCAEDQLLVECARRNAGVIYLVDARPKMSAYANQAKGAGTENPANYPNSRLVFLGIENIHTVRVAHKALFDLVMGQCLSAESPPGWYAGIEKTQWMEHVHSVVRGAARVAEMLMTGKSSVVLHCSDGWDRTAQIASLTQLLLDPYYRTIKGFIVLIEKEWLSFGHPFETRHCHKKPGFWSEHQSSPIFAQWLDCVHQVMTQFPSAFEFNEKLLISILDNSFSLRYVTFMGMCERDRIKFRGVPGLWNELLADETVLNTAFLPCSAMLKVEVFSPAMNVWNSMYLRFFLRHSGGPFAAFASCDPDFERSDLAGGGAKSPELSPEEEEGRRDDLICLSTQDPLVVFDDYECDPTLIPLRAKEQCQSQSQLAGAYEMVMDYVDGLLS
jgi:hypothetical protein